MFNLDEQAALGLTQNHLIEFNGMLIDATVESDLARLIQAAKQDGIAIRLASSFRDFERQSIIWNNKYNGIRPVLDFNSKQIDISKLSDIEKCHAILLYSALPGASRHHFGTDFDIFDSSAVSSDYQLQLVSEEYSENGPFYRLSVWLEKNANEFGFFFPYKHFNGGVASEPWHISHIARSEYYSQLHTVELLEKALKTNVNLLGKNAILQNLASIYQQYVANITPVDNVQKTV